MVTIALAARLALAGDVVYEEDFSSDPGFISLAPEFVFWDSVEANYYAETYRNNDNKYWAYKQLPDFQSAELERISFDFNYASTVQFAMPMLRFASGEPLQRSDDDNIYGLGLLLADRDGEKSTFGVHIQDKSIDNHQLGPELLEPSKWYSLQLEFSVDKTVSVSVFDRDTLQQVYHYSGFEYADKLYRYLAIGFYSWEDLSDLAAPVRIDNLYISLRGYDYDRDGIADGDDFCSETPAGDVVDADGCAISDYCTPDDFSNTGRYIACYRRVLNEFVASGIYRQKEARKILRNTVKQVLANRGNLKTKHKSDKKAKPWQSDTKKQHKYHR